MKILFILFLLFSFNVHAENWMRHSKIKAGSTEGFSFEKDCLRYGEKCYEVGDNPSVSFSENPVQVDDTKKPNYSKNQVSQCADDCVVLFRDLECVDEDESPILNTDLKEIYCSKFLSYDKKTEQQMKVDSVKLSQVNADKAIEATKSLQRKAIAKSRACGDSAISEMIRLNAVKGLTPAQRKTVLKSYDEIKNMLQVGNLDQALLDISVLTPDGVLVIASDKTALVAFINSCK